MDKKDINNTDTSEITETPEVTETSEATDVTPKKKRRKLTFGDYIRFFIMAVALCVFIYSASMLLNIYLEYKKGTDIYKSIAGEVLKPIDNNESESGNLSPDGEAQLPFKYDHKALLNINPEGVGYIYIPSIGVQLPVVQGPDNEYYLTHTFNRVYNSSGAIFEDYRCLNGLKSNNVIIYGHNMKNGSMFAGLHKYLTPSFYKTPGNDIFYIYTENKLMEYRIFSVYISEPVSDTYNCNFASQTDLRAYAANMNKLSSYSTGVDITNATQIVTLSTCTGDGEQRVIVQGTYIGETPLQ